MIDFIVTGLYFTNTMDNIATILFIAGVVALCIGIGTNWKPTRKEVIE